MTCTRCEGTGFLNLHQIPDDECGDGNDETIILWIAKNDDHDVCICDCCGDEDGWYGEPGIHYSSGDGWDTTYGVPKCI